MKNKWESVKNRNLLTLIGETVNISHSSMPNDTFTVLLFATLERDPVTYIHKHLMISRNLRNVSRL